MTFQGRFGRGLVGITMTGAVLMVAGLALLPGRADATLSNVRLTPCIPTETYCAEIDEIQVRTQFAFDLGFTVNSPFSASDRIFGTGPEDTVFNRPSQWVFEVGRSYYSQLRQDFDVYNEGASFTAKVFETLYPPLSPGDRATAHFGIAGSTNVHVGPMDSFYLDVRTNTEGTKVRTNSIPVVNEPPPTFRELTTRIRSGPSGKTKRKRVKFAFGAAGAAGYACRIDSRRWDDSCDSPKRYRVTKGRHIFRVRAVGNDGTFGKIVKRSFRRV
jgi:hypothetical protein